MRMDDENYFLINLDFNRLLVLVPAFPNTHKMNPSELFISIERKLSLSWAPQFTSIRLRVRSGQHRLMPGSAYVAEWMRRVAKLPFFILR